MQCPRKVKPIKQLKIKKHTTIAKSNSPTNTINIHNRNINGSIQNTNIFCVNDITLKTRNKTKESLGFHKVNHSFKEKINIPIFIQPINNNESSPQVNKRLFSYLKRDNGIKTEILLKDKQKKMFDKVFPADKNLNEILKEILEYDKEKPKTIDRLFFVYGDNNNYCLFGKGNNDISMIKKILYDHLVPRNNTNTINYRINTYQNNSDFIQWIIDRDSSNISSQIKFGNIKSLNELDDLINYCTISTFKDIFSLVFYITNCTQSYYISFVSLSCQANALSSIIKHLQEPNFFQTNSSISFIISIYSSQQSLNEITAIYEQQHIFDDTIQSLSPKQEQLQTAKTSKNASKLSSYLTVNDPKYLNKQINDLMIENKKLKVEIANLKIQLNTFQIFQKQFQNIPIISFEFLSNEMKKENNDLMKINHNLNIKFHSELQKFEKLTQELMNIENNIYTFDDKGNINESKEKIICNDNKQYYKNFKNSFMTFFSSLDTNEEFKSQYSVSDLIHLDSLKSTLNSFYFSMDSLIDDFILTNSSSLYQNFIRISFVSIYYERIIHELLNHCLYDHRRTKMYQSLNEMLITIINSVKTNENLSSLIHEIIKKINGFDLTMEEHIENNKQIWLNEMISYKRLFNITLNNQSHQLSTNQSLINKYNHYNEILDLSNSIKQHEIKPQRKEEIFYGYIHNDTIPKMEFDEDEDSINIISEKKQ